MYYLLFTLYLTVAVYLVLRIPFVRKTGLTPKIISILFLLRVLAGVALGWLSQKYYPGNDYWGLNKDGLDEYNLMTSQPVEFLTNIFKSPYQNGYGAFFDSFGSYWNDLRYNIILKLIAFADIFSRGNYYINSLFFNFFAFFGSVALFRVFIHIYKNSTWPVLAGCFLLPSTLYFSSGIHKDLLVLTLLGLYCYALYFSFVHGITLKKFFVIFFSSVILLLIRNYVAIALIPVSLAFIICMARRTKPFTTFISVYTFIFLSLALLQVCLPTFRPLNIITQKQSDFATLPTAATQLKMINLETNLKSFIKNLPQAIDHGFFRPHLWDRKGTFIFPFALELLLYELFALLAILKAMSQSYQPNPFVLFAIFFAVSMLLITGFVIPNTGSILRYKSVYMPLLLVPVFCLLARQRKLSTTN